MTVYDDILEQAKQLSPVERQQLAYQLLNITDDISPQKTGADIVALLEAMDEPIELVDSHLTDPVAWVKAQRNKTNHHWEDQT